MDQKKIGLFISQCRKTKGLTQKELGEQLGVSNKAVSKWERGICLPDVSLFIPLCDLFEIDLNSLLLGENTHLKYSQRDVEKSLLPILNNYQRITKIKRILIIIFFIISPFILLQWNLKFYTVSIIDNPNAQFYYLFGLLYIPAYYFIYKGMKIGYILTWIVYILLSFLFLVQCNYYVNWLFNSFSLDFWFHIIITILSFIDGNISFNNLIKKN